MFSGGHVIPLTFSDIIINKGTDPGWQVSFRALQTVHLNILTTLPPGDLQNIAGRIKDKSVHR